jgi:hypothetical protein
MGGYRAQFDHASLVVLVLLLEQVIGLLEPLQRGQDFVIGVPLCVILHTRHDTHDTHDTRSHTHTQHTTHDTAHDTRQREEA